MSGAFQVFLESEARRINEARLSHLASLGLDLNNKRVLEVGAGIGLHTGFFEERGCDILSTDGAVANVAEMLRRYPNRTIGLIDLDNPGDLSALGAFEIVYCYGTLYHLNHPNEALAQLARVCSGQILLETIVLPGRFSEVQMISEPLVANQALRGTGCRPTRAWVMAALRRHFGHAYTTLDQPDHPDFIKDWTWVDHDGNLRAIFVGSRQPLAVPSLSERLPIRHRNAPPRAGERPYRRVWIDVGAHHGEHSRREAVDDPGLLVHAFEPHPLLAETLKAEAPSNYIVHAVAVAERDGMAPFRTNEFDAASSLLPMDEAVRSAWTEGHLLREGRIVEVPTVRLDSFLDRTALGPVEFLKIDAQGGDFGVLKSIGGYLQTIDRIQVEVTVGDRQLYVGAADKSTIVGFMADRGFRLHESTSQSSGQEENLTFIRIGSETAGASQDLQAEEEVHAYDLATGTLAVGSLARKGDVVELETAKEPWAYTIVVPLDRGLLKRSDRLRVTLEIEVDAGIVQVGILNDSQTDFDRTEMVKPGGWQKIEFVTPEIGRTGPLVIRNGPEHGSSKARVKLLSVRRVAPPASIETTRSAVEFELEGAGSLVDQFAALTEAFSPYLGTLSHGEAAKIASQTDRLRPILAREGKAVIDVDQSALVGRLSRLEETVLVDYAMSLSELRPLARMPGWRFDGFLRDPDFATLHRHALWRALKAKQPQAAAEHGWHGGTRILTRFDNDLSLSIYVAGCFEPNELSLLDRVLAPGMAVLDGGANEGAYTLFLAARVGQTGRVIAVEPSPRERERLRANLALNNFANVDLIESALDERPGTARLFIAATEHGGQNTLGGFVYDHVMEDGSTDVTTTTIDSIVAEQNLDRLDVIKLDIEGAELRALRGARQTIDRFRPLILLEANEPSLQKQGASIEEVEAYLTGLGYVVFAFSEQSGDIVPAGDTEPSDNLVAIYPATRTWRVLFTEQETSGTRRNQKDAIEAP